MSFVESIDTFIIAPFGIHMDCVNTYVWCTVHKIANTCSAIFLQVPWLVQYPLLDSRHTSPSSQLTYTGLLVMKRKFCMTYGICPSRNLLNKLQSWAVILVYDNMYVRPI